MRKVCNNCGFQQNEFLKIGGKNYCNSCNFEISVSSNVMQDSITVSAYESQATYDLLYDSLEWFELYVERTGYYPNWQGKKQLPKTITRPDIDSIDATRMRSMFSTSLTALRNLTVIKPPFFLERLQDEFYKWIDGSGINVNNCPSELVQCLVDISEILKGKGEEFAKARREQVDKNIERMSKEERASKFNEFVFAYQEPLENEEKKAKSMEGKTYKDANNESRFNGDADRGKKIFEQIKKQGRGLSTESSNLTQPNNPQYIPVNENELTPEQRGIIEQVNRELNQQGVNVPMNELIPVASGGLAFVLSLVGLSWFKRRD